MPYTLDQIKRVDALAKRIEEHINFAHNTFHTLRQRAAQLDEDASVFAEKFAALMGELKGECAATLDALDAAQERDDAPAGEYAHGPSALDIIEREKEVLNAIAETERADDIKKRVTFARQYAQGTWTMSQNIVKGIDAITPDAKVLDAAVAAFTAIKKHCDKAIAEIAPHQDWEDGRSDL